MEESRSLHLLVVDDEVLETEYLLTLLQKVPYSFRNISVAFSMEMAKDILKNHPVDLILCDIEMPQGSGLDLLRWVREQALPAEALIITCHPEFTYAQQAMKLSSVDYLLKPIDLEQLCHGVARAAELLERNRAASRYRHDEGKLRDLFFMDLMEENYTQRTAAMEQQMEALALPFSSGEPMVPLYFRLDYASTRTGGATFARRTVLVNIVQDILFQFRVLPWFYFPAEDALFVAFRVSELPEALPSFCANRLQKLMTSSYELLRMSMACFMEQPVAFAALPDCYAALRDKSKEILCCRGEICSLGKLPLRPHPAEGEDGDWVLLMEHGQWGRVRRETEDYLEQLLRSRTVPADEVFGFSQKLIRSVLRYLSGQNIPPATVLPESRQQTLLLRDHFFLEDFCHRVQETLGDLEVAVRAAQGEGNLTERICRYIQVHVEEDFDRQTLARQFGLSPEHLSRLFHQDAGLPLVAFITKTKLEFCREMLETTDCTVRQAAERVGYTNFSYFAKLFRDAYGCTPQQYRESRKAEPQKTSTLS